MLKKISQCFPSQREEAASELRKLFKKVVQEVSLDQRRSGIYSGSFSGKNGNLSCLNKFVKQTKFWMFTVQSILHLWMKNDLDVCYIELQDVCCHLKMDKRSNKYIHFWLGASQLFPIQNSALWYCYSLLGDYQEYGSSGSLSHCSVSGYSHIWLAGSSLPLPGNLFIQAQTPCSNYV